MLEFNPETHEYFFNGRKVPSVTGILKEVGLIDGEWFTDEARERGKAVHAATELLDLDDLDLDSLHPKIEPYVRAYQKFKNDTGFKPELIEHRVFNNEYNYAGTLDRTGFFPDGDEVILDIKSGPISGWAALQISAYDYCLDKARQRMALQLKNDGTYKVKSFKGHSDLYVFFSAAVIVNWKLNQKKGIA
jgi:hypothetical protein